MRKNVNKMAISGLFFLFLSIVFLVFIDNLNKFGNNIGLIVIAALIALSIIFLSISANLIGKGDHLISSDLIPGKEYILIDHVMVNEKKSFSLVGTPNSEKFVTVYYDDKIGALGPKQSFIIVKKEVRKLC